MQYAYFWQMADTFHIPMMYLFKVIKRGTCALARAAEELPHEVGGLAQPTAAQLGEWAGKVKVLAEHGLQSAMICINGMCLRTRAPPAHRRGALNSTHYNGHYSCWGQTMLTMTGLDGTPLHVFGPTPASESSLVKLLSVRELLLASGLPVVTDSLYAFNTLKTEKSGEAAVKHFFTMGPKTLNKVKRIAFDESLRFTAVERRVAKQMLFTTRYLGQLRAVNENFNGRLRRFAILQSPYRGQLFSELEKHSTYVAQPANIMKCIIFVVKNRMLFDGKRLRRPDWQPKPTTLADEPMPKNFVVGYPSIAGSPVARNGYHLSRIITKLWSERVPKSKKKSKGKDEPILNEDDEAASTSDENEAADVDLWAVKGYVEKGDFMVDPVGTGKTTGRQLDTGHVKLPGQARLEEKLATAELELQNRRNGKSKRMTLKAQHAVDELKAELNALLTGQVESEE